ncbi:MAG: phytoene desaturase family protein [Candidatus Nanopelagicales bacterium]
MTESMEVVVIGSGINGLSAAALLAVSGKKVIVLESNPVAGGAIRTGEVTAPGFRHDLFAMNLGLFAGGPVMAQLGDQLAAHGFSLLPSAKPFCSVYPDGSMIGVEADASATVHNLAAVAPEDVHAWEELTAKLGIWAPFLIGTLGSDLPSVAAVKTLWKAHRTLGTVGIYELVKLALQSTRSFTDENFSSPKTKALFATWGMHLDFAPDVSGGALFSFLETIGGQLFGMVIGEGGASSLVDALVSVIEANGGEVRCNARVEQITMDESKRKRNRATGVVLEGGAVITASRAVVSNVNPRLMPALFPASVAAEPAIKRVEKFQSGLATMMIHVALNDLPSWTATEARTYNYVHIGPYVDDMAMTYTDAAAGRLPASPTLVIGQPTITDPGRAPDGKHILWIQVRMLPLDLADGSHWDDIAEQYADRVMEKIEEYAPGLTSLVIARTVMSPLDLERYNVNLIKGDSLGGSHHPSQFFFLRPVPGWGRHRSPVDNLYICGSGTWPGGGVGGSSGAMVAKILK